MPTQSENWKSWTEEAIDRWVGTNVDLSDHPGSEAGLKKVADRCLDCGYWTLLEWLEDGVCTHCDAPEPEAEDEW